MQLPKTSIITNSGFSIIEILVVLGIFCIAIGCTVFFTSDSLRQYSYYSSRDTLISLLQHARAQSLANVCVGTDCAQAQAHGVALEAERFVLFQGADFETRDISQDVVVEASPRATSSGMSVVIFAASSGDVSSPGTILYADSEGHESEITIGSEGQISWTH